VNFILYDLEATCWLGRPPKGISEIIEIGAYKVNPYGEILSHFSQFIRPVVNPILSPFCTRLTSIKQDDVRYAPKFEKAIEEFKDWVNIYDEDYLLCSWGKFDIKMLRNDCELFKLDTDWLEHHINLKAQYHRIINTTKFTGLKTTIDREGFEFEGVHHRAISDAFNLTKIFNKYIDEWEY
jgi:inhibitor of KinA sporulation pathway (predicted exonuclease)